MTTATASRKRKRDDDRLLLGDPFQIQPYALSSLDEPIKLVPAVALPRRHIPLSWSAGLPSRLFSCPFSIPAASDPNTVVIAKIDGERQLCAIETTQDGVNVVYRLSPLVKLKEVRRIAAQVRKASVSQLPSATSISDRSQYLGGGWWKSFSVDFAPPSKSARPLVGTLMVAGATQNDALPTPNYTPPKVDVPTASQFSLEDVLEQVRAQYRETLYTAKTSLAYFAKSTLSRARAACRENEGSGGGLINGLISMVLPYEIDEKFRKKVPAVVYGSLVEYDEDVLGDEQPYIRKWAEKTFQGKLPEREDHELREKLEELRIRETELQIILILEILALRSESPATTPAVEEPQVKSKKKSKKGKKSKKSKEVNYESFLELLIDRLCIWKMIGLSSEPTEDPSPGQKAGTDTDHLQHFCIEVVMAFYVARLPAICSNINSRLSPAVAPRKSSLTNEKERRRPLKIPTLKRSVTAPSDFASIVAADAVSKGPSRGGNLNKANLAKREVSIDPKVPRKDAKSQLQEAITALKRPNRTAAAAEIVGDKERREAGAKRTKKLARTQSANLDAERKKIQVMATPKKRKPGAAMPAPSVIPFPTIMETPSRRRPSYASSVVAETPLKQSSSVVKGTPFRIPESPFGFSSAAGGVALPAESPLLRRALTEGSQSMLPPTPSFVPETPPKAKKRKEDGGIRKPPPVFSLMARSAGKENGKAVEEKEDDGGVSLYQQMGWDDDFPV